MSDDMVIIDGIVNTCVELRGTVQILKEHEKYIGPYVVTPSANEQKLYTADKAMTQDVTIESIPYFEVSNTSGGTTAIIGGND